MAVRANIKNVESPGGGPGRSVSARFLALLAMGTSMFSFWRCFYGAEITDEILPLGEAWLLQGATPFVDNWLPTSGFAIFWAGPVYLYRALTGSLEGLFLFARLFSVAVRLLFALTCAWLLRKAGVGILCCIAAYTLTLAFEYGSIKVYSYISLSFSLLVLMGTYGYWILQDLRHRKNHLVALGVLGALCIYCQPGSVVAVLVVFLLVLLAGCQRSVPGVWLPGVCGGAATAAILTIWMLWHGGGVHRLVYGMESILRYNPYFQLPKATVAEAVSALAKAAYWMLVLLVALLAARQIAYKVMHKRCVWLCKALYMGGCCIFCVLARARHWCTTWVRWPQYILCGKRPGGCAAGRLLSCYCGCRRLLWCCL